MRAAGSSGGRATRLAVLGVGAALVVAGTAVAVGVGLQNPGFDSGLGQWTLKVDRPAGNGVPGDDQGKPNRQVVYGPGGSASTVVPCAPGDRYGICLITGDDTFTTTSGTTKTVSPRSPSNMLRLGGPYLNPFQKQHANHRFLAEQTFVVDGTMPDLKIRNKIFTYDSAPHLDGRPGGRDHLEIHVLDDSGALIRDQRRYAFDPGEDKRLVGMRWRGMRVNLSAYAGETVTLRVGLVGAGDKLRGTWAYIDPSLVSRPSKTLTVALVGNGTGTVAGPGISCPPDCAETYPVGASVDLSGAAASDSVFAGFGDACSGSSCHLVMDAPQLVSAVFNRSPDTQAPTVTIKGPHGKVKVRKKFTQLRFTLTADESNVRFKCKLDSRTPRGCESPYRTRRLKVGKHRLIVTATDAAGNTGPPARRAFKLVPAKK